MNIRAYELYINIFTRWKKYTTLNIYDPCVENAKLSKVKFNIKEKAKTFYVNTLFQRWKYSSQKGSLIRLFYRQETLKRGIISLRNNCKVKRENILKMKSLLDKNNQKKKLR